MINLVNITTGKEYSLQFNYQTNELSYNGKSLSEYDYKRDTKSHIQVIATDKCNMNPRCPWCYAKYMVPQPVEFNYERFKRLIETDRFNGIGLYGGEPLTMPNAVEALIKLGKEFPHIDCSVITNGILLEEYIDSFVDNNIFVRLEALNFINNYNKWPNIYKLNEKGLLEFSFIKFSESYQNQNDNNLYTRYKKIKSILGSNAKIFGKCCFEIDIDNMDRFDFNVSDLLVESILVTCNSCNIYKLEFNKVPMIPCSHCLVIDNSGQLVYTPDYAYPLGIYADEVDPLAACLMSYGHTTFLECNVCKVKNFCRYPFNGATNCTRWKYNAVVFFYQELNKECIKYFGPGIYIPTNADEYFDLPELSFPYIQESLIKNN